MTKVRVCFIGDSITNGTGDSKMLGWPGYLCQAEVEAGHDMTDYNLGIRGDTSDDIAPRWRAEVEARLPARQRSAINAAIVFNFGLNDATMKGEGEAAEIRVPLSRSIKTAREMLGTARGIAPTLWVGPSAVDDSLMPLRNDAGDILDKRNARTADYNLAFRALADELQIPYLDMLSKTINDKSWPGMLSDGLHPADAGHQHVAGIVGAWDAWRGLLAG
jgi:acyl-CoA thioesterase-1